MELLLDNNLKSIWIGYQELYFKYLKTCLSNQTAFLLLEYSPR
jgi:hypothetical protein